MNIKKLLTGIMAFCKERVVRRTRGKKAKFPNKLDRIWLAYNCTHKIDGYFQSGEIRNLQIEDRVPVLKSSDGLFAIYEVVASKPMQGSDRSAWDDGCEYDLKLFKVSNAPECYKLKPKMGFNFIR